MSLCKLPRRLAAPIAAAAPGSIGSRRFGLRSGDSRSRAFTLVELLIVISIIAVLSSLVIAGVAIAKRRQEETEAKTTITMLAQAISQYQLDEGKIPAFGLKPDPEQNYFPVLWTALMDEREPVGKGGKSAPYLSNPPKERIAVKEGDTYRTATRDELDDPKVDKYVLDPWGMPYFYRCNKGLKKQEWMLNPKTFDLYSFGRNNIDDSLRTATDEEEIDDVVNSG